MADISKELGQPGGLAPDPEEWFRETSTGWVVDPTDPNPDLRFPHSTAVYDLMRRTDGQVGSHLRAMTLPIRKARWALSGDDVRPEVLEFVRGELGLELPDEGRARRRRHGIVWAEHLREALLCLPLGFMPFEQVYLPARATPEEEAALGQTYVIHLRKLAARMPSTVSQIHVGKDGGLAGISQRKIDDRWGISRDQFLPVERLVYYVIDKEGADWSGVSVLRTAYKDWLIKDNLVRLNAQIIERNGMGLPILTYDGAIIDRESAIKIVRDIRAGAHAGSAIPQGATLDLKGVSGSTKDALPTIQHHNQEMSKSVLAMFLDLGHDSGARSLGETFADFFTDSLQAVADALAETATEHIIRDLVELNFGPNEPYPVLSAGDLGANRDITAAALKTLVDARVVTPDEILEARIRRDFGLPEADPASAREAPAPAAPGAPVPGEGPILPDPAAALAEGDHLDRAEALLRRLVEIRGAGSSV